MFKIIHSDGKARAGELTTAHGRVKTPFFMPVATKAVGKFIDAKDLEDLGAECIISNAFVLCLAPGVETVQEMGGIHRFMNFKNSIFTDSGGFQMYSQEFLLRRNPDGVKFSNPIGGGEVFVTPEKDMDMQIRIGSDVAMCLDDMPRFGANRKRVLDSLKKTFEWAKRCKKYHDEHGGKQLLFGIAQGGVYPDLRRDAAKQISGLDFDGIAFGGLALGEPQEEMFSAVKAGLGHMPEEKPKYMMGLGNPRDILNAIAHGIDCFDSTFPTMTARHNKLLTMGGSIDIENKAYARDQSPVEEGCDCPACKNYTRAYMHHLSRTREPAGMRLRTMHNIRFMARLMEEAGKAIRNNEFGGLLKRFSQAP